MLLHSQGTGAFRLGLMFSRLFSIDQLRQNSEFDQHCVLPNIRLYATYELRLENQHSQGGAVCINNEC